MRHREGSGLLESRELWPDIAKGVCIILVVLWHVVVKHFQQVDWDTDLPVSAFWGQLGEALLPLRMPLFFAVSGMFAASALARPLRVLVRTRIAKFAYLYVVWVLIHTVIMWFTPHVGTAHATNLWQLLEYFTIDPTNLWYLYALAVYFTIARLVRPLPRSWILSAAFVLTTATASHLLTDPGNSSQVLQNLFFFLAGLYGRELLERLASRANVRLLLICLVGYAGCVAAMTRFGAETWFGVWPAVSIIAIVFGVTAAAVIARRARRTARTLAYLGRRTLPIYVMHLALFAVFDQLTREFDVEPTGVAYAVIEPILVTALLICACLGLERLLRRLHADFLFDPPFAMRPSRTAGRRVPS